MFWNDNSRNIASLKNTKPILIVLTKKEDNPLRIKMKEKIMAKEVKTEEATRKIEVFYKLQQTKMGTKFKKWLTTTKDGKIYQVRFVLGAVPKVPSARATIYVKDEDMNWNKENPKYPVLYITNIEKVEQKESAPEDFDNYFEKA